MEKNGMTVPTDIHIKVADYESEDYTYTDEMDDLVSRVTDKLSDADKPNSTLG